jgi:hypothetical protein
MNSVRLGTRTDVEMNLSVSNKEGNSFVES